MNNGSDRHIYYLVDNYGASVTDKVELIFYWKSRENRQPNECRIRIYWLNEAEAVVIASNVIVFPGRTTIDIIPEIIDFVCNNFDLLPHQMMLIEHYSFGELSYEDIYLWVVYFNNEAIRQMISRYKLTSLIGKQI